MLGPILNNCSLDTIRRYGSGYQMGHAVIKAIKFVDDWQILIITYNLLVLVIR